MNKSNGKNWISRFSLGLTLVLAMFMWGCSSVSDPETMKTANNEQTQNDNDQAQEKTAQNQKSTSGRILAAGSHITGAMFGG